MKFVVDTWESIEKPLRLPRMITHQGRVYTDLETDSFGPRWNTFSRITNLVEIEIE